MEDLTTILIGFGGLSVVACLVLSLVEFATVRIIRAPERRTFTYIRLAETQFQTIVAPAMGALLSGLFISISASFFYEGFTRETEDWRQAAGGLTFIAGAVALALTLRSALKGVGEPAALAKDPFTIRAAADEYVTQPREALLTPQVLTTQLAGWAAQIPARSLNVSADVESHRLTEALDRAADATGVRAIWPSFRVYVAALSRFPFRFGWPTLGLTVFCIGVLWYAFAFADFETRNPWAPVLASAIMISIGAFLTALYGVARGNRARLWHRVNRRALIDARDAIRRAEQARAVVVEEDARMQRVLTRADDYLRQHTPGSAPGGKRTVLRLRVGRLDLELSWH
ncbi:hypothetical protein PFZ55_45965 [Streptomyces sp. MS2A]|nr:hypothetical protein [Streptomyces sp. MS2A]